MKSATHPTVGVYEEKYDGWRMVACKDVTAVRLVSRAGKDHSRRFAELAAGTGALLPATPIHHDPGEQIHPRKRSVVTYESRTLSISVAALAAPSGLSEGRRPSLSRNVGMD